MTKMAPGLVESNLYIHSTFNSTDTPKNVLPLESIQNWSLGQEPLTSSSATDLNFLKAAWILTLRCFEPEDVINLNYDKGTITQSEFSATYTVRVDPDWDVASLLKALQPQENGKLTSSESQFAHSRSICNAELRYVTNPSVTLSSEPFLGERLEVSCEIIGFLRSLSDILSSFHHPACCS